MANTNSRRFFVGGNWKMNCSKTILDNVNETLSKTVDTDGRSMTRRTKQSIVVLLVDVSVEIVCAPPALFIKDFLSSKPGHVQVAAQNCYHAKDGAFTGEIR
jgi:triosephosphate isomerase (TIM)